MQATPPPDAPGTENRQDSDAPIDSHARRSFLGKLGGLTASTWTAAALGVAPLLVPTEAGAANDPGHGSDNRLAQCFALRRDAALHDRQAGEPPHPSNGDEARYANRIGNFSKGLPHNSVGEVDPQAYRSLLDAVNGGGPQDFERIILGGGVKLVNPQAGLAFDMEGVDSHQLAEPPSPAVAGAQRAAEAVELYWQALLRDVNFADYSSNALALQACNELSPLAAFTGPGKAGASPRRRCFAASLPAMWWGRTSPSSCCSPSTWARCLSRSSSRRTCRRPTI